MRIVATVELFLNPEILHKESVDKNQATTMIANALELSLLGMGELIHASTVEVKVAQEGPNAAN